MAQKLKGQQPHVDGSRHVHLQAMDEQLGAGACAWGVAGRTGTAHTDRRRGRTHGW